MINRIFLYGVDVWWRPVSLFVVLNALLILNGVYGIQSLKEPLSFLVDFSIIILLISIGYQIFKRRFSNAFSSLFILFLAGVVSMMFTMVDGDHWADDLKIPTGIQLENPIDMIGYERPDSILRMDKTKVDFVLYNAEQPGIYEYDFWAEINESGFIYLKAFEITQEVELSANTIDSDSKIFIHDFPNAITRYSSNKFTIYEGDWGKYYAARFEVWFKPTAGGHERKLFQKNFKIEGWMH